MQFCGRDVDFFLLRRPQENRSSFYIQFDLFILRVIYFTNSKEFTLRSFLMSTDIIILYETERLFTYDRQVYSIIAYLFDCNIQHGVYSIILK